MAVGWFHSFWTGAAGMGGGEGGGPFSGTASLQSTYLRRGPYAIRINPASGASGGFGAQPTGLGSYFHFALYVISLPSVSRMICGTSGAGAANLTLNSDGTLSHRVDTTVTATSGTALALNTWYWVGVRFVSGTSVTWIQINGKNEGSTATATISSTGNFIGCIGAEASAIDYVMDDFVIDTAGFLTECFCASLRPVSDDTITNWTAGNGGTTNLFDAVDNIPATAAVASASETDLTNIESSSATGTAAYIAAMQPYSTVISQYDTVLAISGTANVGEDISTGAKNGNITITQNPNVGAGANFGFGNAAHGAWNSGNWQNASSGYHSLPTISLTQTPLIKITKTDTTGRTGCVGVIQLRVCYQPGPITRIDPYRQILPQ